MSPSGENLNYLSIEEHDSTACAGVKYTIRRVSARRRLELVRSIRELVRESEYREAGKAALDKLESAMLSRGISNAYFVNGFDSVQGLLIDGEIPSAESMWAKGPEALVEEITKRIRESWHLNDEARKNS